MTETEQHESRFWDVLTKERLVDLSQFHRSGFFDEVPLYTRSSDVDFLADYSEGKANGILLGFALKFLQSVVSYEEHRRQYFAAITVWSPAEGDRVVPNLFVRSGSVRGLRSKLILGAATEPFSKKIGRIIAGRHLRNRFRVLQDTTTDPSDTRVFISVYHKPYKNFVTLNEFRGPARSRIGRS